MNRFILIILVFTSFLIFPQTNNDKYIEEANKMYIKGDYEGAFSQINNYFYITEGTDVTDKGRQLGESIYFFYIRSLFSSNQFIALSLIDKSLEDNPFLASDRVLIAYEKLKVSTNELNNSASSETSIDIYDDVLETSISTQYSKDELTSLLKSSLLSGQESSKQVGRVTFLLGILIIIILLVIILIAIFVVLSIKSSKKLSTEGNFTPTLIGQRYDSVNEFDSLLVECRRFAGKIDNVTGRKNNSLNSAELVYKISREYGFSEKESLLYFSASLVYDIGLLGIDENILRSDSITEEEYAVIQKHVGLGESYMSFVPERYKKTFFEAITMHHENLDGTGYPLGLTDGEIPYLPRVLRVVESYLSQISSRKYKVISDKVTAIRHLKNESGCYDIDIVEILDKVI